MTEHDYQSHYRIILDNEPAERARLGTPEQAYLAELVLCTVVDDCEPCLKTVTRLIGTDALAMVAVRRLCALMLGVGFDDEPGSAEEAQEVAQIGTDPYYAKWMIIETVKMTAARMAEQHLAEHEDHDENCKAAGQYRVAQVRRPRRKRKPVRHPSRRVRRPGQGQ